ncbi:MAG TPA: hypothetical protein EYG68_07335 [Leucothrix mucor]|nr:hypothetical protein [Leucothrix mucor]
MKSEAIRCAIKLYSEPTLLARFDDPFKKLPRGITELLRIVSSESALTKVSAKNNLHASRLREILVNYIQLILLQSDNTNRRKLGLDQNSDTLQVKLHYKLLMNIFHPDKSAKDVNPRLSQIILHAYKAIQNSPKNISNTTSQLNTATSQAKSYHSGKAKTLAKSQKISFLKISIITFTIIVFGLILFTPSTPQLISKTQIANVIN